MNFNLENTIHSLLCYSAPQKMSWKSGRIAGGCLTMDTKETASTFNHMNHKLAVLSQNAGKAQQLDQLLTLKNSDLQIKLPAFWRIKFFFFL